MSSRFSRYRRRVRYRKCLLTTGSGERGLGDPEQLVRFGGRRREAVVVGTEPGDLELKVAYLGTQDGHLVEQATVSRAAHVAVEGLRHIFSFECVAGMDASKRAHNLRVRRVKMDSTH